MTRARSFVVAAAAAGLVGLTPELARPAPRSSTTVLFDLDTPAGTPFPSDIFTAEDPRQNTCQRVALPSPDCAKNASDCANIAMLNELDGFNVRPRVSIPFSDPVDLASVTDSTVFLLSLGDAVVGGAPSCAPFAGEDVEEDRFVPPDAGRKIAVNQLVWDGDSNTLYGEAAELLDQHTRYALIVTSGVLDTSGQPVQRSKEFTRAIGDDDEAAPPVGSRASAYQTVLRAAVAMARIAGVRRHDIAAAAVFTTMSVTAALEKFRDHAAAGQAPAVASFEYGPQGATQSSVFERSDVADITYNEETGAGKFTAVRLNTRLPLLDQCSLGVSSCTSPVRRIAYGTFAAPNYLKADATTEAVATFSGTPALMPIRDDPSKVVEPIAFDVFLPQGTQPAGGWPVVIYGHGSGDSLNGAAFNVAATFARHGIATISFNEPGHGFGPNSTVTVTLKDGTKQTFPVRGRALDLPVTNADGSLGPPDGIYAAGEGGTPVGPARIFFSRDSARQFTADMIQLIRVLKAGVDIVGKNGVTDHLNASRLYYSGLSAGAVLGTMVTVLTEDIRATGVASVGGWPSPELSPPKRGPVGTALQQRSPSLLNPPGTPIVTVLGGLSVAAPFFNEGLPLADAESAVGGTGSPPGARAVVPLSYPVVNRIPGAIRIQEFLERLEWLNGTSAPGAFAPHLSQHPLAGIRARPYLLQVPRGDRTIANPNTLDTIRSGALEEQVTVYRHDLFGSNTAFLDPHSFMIRTDNAVMKNIAVMAQEQLAAFFESDGQAVIDPDGPATAPCVRQSATIGAPGGCLFEVPANPVPEGYGFTLPLSP